MAYTNTTLAEQILGEINQDRNAAGGTVPDRLTAIVTEAKTAIDETWPWQGTGTAPKRYDLGWHLLSLAMAQEAFVRNPSVWQATYNAYAAWLKEAKEDTLRVLLSSQLSAASESTPDGIAATLTVAILGSKSEAMDVTDRTLLYNSIRSMCGTCYTDFWTMTNWAWRRKSGTITTVANQSYANLPSDFDILDAKWVEEEAAKHGLSFVTDAEQFRTMVAVHGTTAGTPVAAYIEAYTDTTIKYKVILTPTPSEALDYPIYYLSTPPSLSGTGTPIWPTRMTPGYVKYCRAAVFASFGKGVAADRAMADWDRWREEAMARNLVQTGTTTGIEDGNKDYGSLASMYGGAYP